MRFSQPKNDPTALFHLTYGLFVATTRVGDKDNGLIVNTVTQVASSPLLVAVSVNCDSLSHEMILESGKLNVNCLSEATPFSAFERFGFQSGRDCDKLAGVRLERSQNGLAVLTEDYCTAFLSLCVRERVELGSHTLFICSVEQAEALSSAPPMTYAYYHANVKPRPQEQKKPSGYVCRICGWVYEGEPLPDDVICPICKHGAADFEKIS